jgi:hypothetical protein
MRGDIKMKPGDKVTIYSDPFTKKKIEGIAKIFKIERADNIYTEALVVFDGEKEKYFRIICTD